MLQQDVQRFTAFHKVSRPAFLAALGEAQRLRGDQGLCVSEPEEGADLFLSDDGLAGYALVAGYLGSVFSMAKGRLGRIVLDARARARRNGAAALTIDCFAPLAAVYARHGFAEECRVPFDWAYAPEGWSSRMGEPDVVVMSLPTGAASAIAAE